MNRYDRGRHEYQGLMGSAPEESLAEIRRRAPLMYDALVEGGFGGTLAHAELGRAYREIATVAMLSAIGGAENQLATHTRAALRQGITATELIALCEHVAGYAGFPRGLNALAVIDEVLADAGIPRPATLRRVALSDHETVVAQRGDTGPAVVLLHALGLDHQMWEPVMNALATGRRVFAYDLRGHGWAAGSPNPFTMPDTAADLIGVLDALDLDKAHVVGLSYGGGIAQAAAVAYPERFASLSLLATTDQPFEAFEGRARSAETDGMAAQVVPSLTRWFTPEGLAEGGWGVRYARELVLRGNVTDWARAWRAFKGIDVQDRLAGFRAPTLVLAGERDASTGPDLMRAIAGRIPGARYQELPGVPHMQTLEQPELVAVALAEFLPT
ncbi:MAG TPA: alpha/beta fold hydrolase [Mycobacteriales bacterium]|jgi:3-oxoadipate enol-lactonase|nr:alpha/beta fold hydrolase [Mycobacteriales bacterium]